MPSSSGVILEFILFSSFPPLPDISPAQVNQLVSRSPRRCYAGQTLASLPSFPLVYTGRVQCLCARIRLPLSADAGNASPPPPLYRDFDRPFLLLVVCCSIPVLTLIFPPVMRWCALEGPFFSTAFLTILLLSLPHLICSSP